MKLWQKNLLLLLLVVVITVVPLMIAKGSEFGGADGAAEGVITEINSDYKPWASPLFEPASGEIESMLFALQAAIGAGIIGFGFGRLSAAHKYRANEKK
jgi:cobalt/nickel transport protein